MFHHLLGYYASQTNAWASYPTATFATWLQMTLVAITVIWTRYLFWIFIFNTNMGVIGFLNLSFSCPLKLPFLLACPNSNTTNSKDYNSHHTLEWYFFSEICSGSTCCPFCLKTTFRVSLLSLLSPSLSPADDGSAVLGFDKLPWWGVLLISIGCAILTGIIVWFAVCPCLKKKIERESSFNLFLSS